MHRRRLAGALRQTPGKAPELVMYNIAPDGQETIAFRNVYERN